MCVRGVYVESAWCPEVAFGCIGNQTKQHKDSVLCNYKILFLENQVIKTKRKQL